MSQTLYLLPGLLCDATVWRHQERALGRAYDVRIPQWGDLSTIPAMAQRVLATAPERFSLAGHSMGARVALEIVRQAPARVDRLALLDTGVHPPTADERGRREVLVTLGETSGMRALADAWLPPMVGELRFATDAELRASLYDMVQRMNPVIHRNQIEALLRRPDATPVLSTIRCPVLVGVGSDDRWSPPAQHEAIAAAIPQARYVVFENSGHMAPMEAAEAVTRALEQWMTILIR